MSNIESKRQLIEYFIKGTKKKDQLLIGVEHEKFLFSGKEKRRVDYEQIKKIFKNLEPFGWKPVYEKKMLLDLKQINNKLQPNQDYNMNSLELH